VDHFLKLMEIQFVDFKLDEEAMKPITFVLISCGELTEERCLKAIQPFREEIEFIESQERSIPRWSPSIK
jgi:hypothetical protein